MKKNAIDQSSMWYLGKPLNLPHYTPGESGNVATKLLSSYKHDASKYIPAPRIIGQYKSRPRF